MANVVKILEIIYGASPTDDDLKVIIKDLQKHIGEEPTVANVTSLQATPVAGRPVPVAPVVEETAPVVGNAEVSLIGDDDGGDAPEPRGKKGR
jgi:hypothetical protein